MTMKTRPPYRPSSISNAVLAAVKAPELPPNPDTPPPPPIPDLAGAEAAAEAAVRDYDAAYAVLQSTHVSIPRLLAARIEAQSVLGAAEVSGGDTDNPRRQLGHIESSRQAAVRARSAALAALIAQEEELHSARAEVDAARQSHAAAIISNFEGRYAAAIAALQTLSAEAAALSSALRTEVPAPIPAVVAGIDQDARLVRDLGNAAAPPIDPTAARIGAMLSRLDAAISFSTSRRDAPQRERNLRVPDSSRGFDPTGVFEVARAGRRPTSGQFWTR